MVYIRGQQTFSVKKPDSKYFRLYLLCVLLQLLISALGESIHRQYLSEGGLCVLREHSRKQAAAWTRPAGHHLLALLCTPCLHFIMSSLSPSIPSTALKLLHQGCQ